MSDGSPASNIARLLRVADKMGASYRVKKSIVEAALVESGARHIRGGDRDSSGILQQRPSMGWGSANDSIEKDAQDYLKRAIPLDRKFKGTSGQLAQAVQRSAFPDRYDQRSRDAAKYVNSIRGGGGTSSPGGTVTATSTVPVPGVDLSKQRMMAKLQYLEDPAARNSSTGLINLQGTLNNLRDVPQTSVTRTASQGFAGASAQGPISNGGKVNILELAKMAKRHGLSVREDGVNDSVDPVHAPGSYHYRKLKYDGGKARAAFDASGDPAAMARFARDVARKYSSSLAELFWNGQGATNLKNGKRVPKGFVSGHTDHVHVADVN